ncbi:MAG: hypothetical protein VYE15_05385 [Myxococcota bacterium]|nr:hypothetical protein [Myxococcota bacterium]
MIEDARGRIDPFDLEEEQELNEEELEHYKGLLLTERSKIVDRLQRHMGDALEDDSGPGDEVDMANRQVDRQFQMKIADKERKLLSQIDRALAKFSAGDYGICEGSGDVIRRKRLQMRPWTRYSIQYKEQLERQKRKH